MMKGKDKCPPWRNSKGENGELFLAGTMKE